MWFTTLLCRTVKQTCVGISCSSHVQHDDKSLESLSRLKGFHDEIIIFHFADHRLNVLLESITVQLINLFQNVFLVFFFPGLYVCSLCEIAVPENPNTQRRSDDPTGQRHS